MSQYCLCASYKVFGRYLGLAFLLLSTSTSYAYYRNDFWIPQTHTLERGDTQFSVGRRANVKKQKTDALGYGHESTFGTSFGIWEKDIVGVEGGLDWIEPATGDLSEGIYGHLRLRVKDVQKDGWAVAMGIDRLGFVASKNDVNMIYLNLQNKISEKWLVGVGGYNGNSKHFPIATTGRKSDPKGFFAGLWRNIQRGRGRIGVEYMSGQSVYGNIVAGMTVQFIDGVNGNIAYGYANNQKLVRDWLLTRLSVEF